MNQNVLQRQIRKNIIEMIYEAQSGHHATSLSLVEILIALYSRGMHELNGDLLILSKGHGVPALYAILSEFGFLDEGELKTFRQFGSALQGHPVRNLGKGIHVTTGSLGMGFSVGVGLALSRKMKDSQSKIFVIMGDGECQEGQVWEAAMVAAHYKLHNLVVIIDRNKIQSNDYTENVISLEPLCEKWYSFGWDVYECDGHNVDDLIMLMEGIRTIDNKKPSVIIAKTVKGCGISFMENNPSQHSNAIIDDQYRQAIQELGFSE